MEELVACDAKGQETLANTPEVVQKITQAGPYAFHRVTVHTCPVRSTTRVLARTMVDRPMVIGSRSEMINVVLIGEELCPDFHLGGDHRFAGRSAHMP